MNETGTSAISDKLDQVFAEDKTFSGSVLIAQAGTVLLKKGYSIADTANNIKNSSATKSWRRYSWFRLGQFLVC
jgi:CubicO group peptidase (beta-lactamase class C family)